MSDATTIVLSLISHTNIGKTTLSRTLLRQDVGEVRDAPHVTQDSSRHVMWSAGKDLLVIWDTPGFGNVQALLKRLQREHGALGWLLNEVVDRLVNRPLYSSLEAARNVRAEADVVLYLINAREHPEDAGYVGAELELLDALGKPVLMIFNQVTPEGGKAAELEQAWRACYGHHACFKGTLLLDAFTRSWHHELHLTDLVRPLLPPAKQTALDRLRAQFILAQRNIFTACTESAATILIFAGNQRISATEERDDAFLFASLVKELQQRLDDYLDQLAKHHGIMAEGRVRLNADIKQVTGLLEQPLSESRAGLLAGAVTGAGSGLMADILSGGLTLGGGVLLGFLSGYVGGFSLARMRNLFARGNKVAWKPEALVSLFKLLLSYYLLAALHGRGKGALAAEEIAPFLAEAVEAHWPDLEAEVLEMLRMYDEDEALRQAFSPIFQEAVVRILHHIYPEIGWEEG